MSTVKSIESKPGIASEHCILLNRNLPKPVCTQCGSINSLLWRNQESRQICNECYLANIGGKDGSGTRSEDEDKEGGSPARATGRGIRKSTRATRYKPPVTTTPAAPTPGPRARGRRARAKRIPLRAPTATATLVTSDSIFYKGSYMQVGDVVSVQDVRGGTYYAQIRGFLTDQYCEKSAVLTWLLPTTASPLPEEGFDPATYIIGPEESLPRKLEYMEWVMHAPSDYYMSTGSPYARSQPRDYAPFIWTSVEALRARKPDVGEAMSDAPEFS